MKMEQKKFNLTKSHHKIDTHEINWNFMKRIQFLQKIIKISREN